jgi:hypothetical protein
MSMLRAAVLLAFASAACSDDSGATPDLSTCSARWSTLDLQGEMDAYAPWHLRWHDAELYYPQLGPPERFVALPESGGTPRAVVDDYGLELWIDDAQLLYAHGDNLYAVPTDGGDAMQIAEGGTFGVDAIHQRDLSFHAYALDDAYLYWTVWEYPDHVFDSSVWRLARTGGHSERLGAASTALEALVPSSEQLLAADSFGHVYTLPRDGGELQALPGIENAELIAAADGGLLWSIWRADGAKSQRLLQWSAPSGGEPKAFWPDKSPAIEPTAAWSDVPGSWVLYAVEPFSDGQSHLSVWSVDTGGQARRLGCDPVPAGPGVFASSGALSPDAVFVAVQRSHGWQFVRVPRR